ncbi:unnamed protein product [Allacma fusca]|uniref:Uncharacterized protein n=1 Tax=Allacma fusca TaxID=39272 RepID=A0A8J2LKI3_9HEXA|nr:unnamed protein product [Allacma fusca]
MNFDLVVIPAQKFIINKKNEAHVHLDQPYHALTRCRTEPVVKDEELLKFDPFLQKDAPKSAANTGIVFGDDLFDQEPTERDSTSIEETLSSLIQIQEHGPAKSKCVELVGGHIDLDWIVSSISPPEECRVEGKRYIRYVSKAAVDPSDAYVLERKLDKYLHERQAYPTGFCTIRRGLYDECFNEIIRQIAVSGSRERAVLFLRFREDLLQTTSTYLNLFASTISYCTFKESRRHALLKQERSIHMKDDLGKLQKMYKDLQEELNRTYANQNKELEKNSRKYKEEIDCLKTNNLRLKKQFADFTSTNTQKVVDEARTGGSSRSKSSRSLSKDKSRRDIGEEE